MRISVMDKLGLRENILPEIAVKAIMEEQIKKHLPICASNSKFINGVGMANMLDDMERTFDSFYKEAIIDNN